MAVWRTLDLTLMARLLLAASEERRSRPAPPPREERPQPGPSLATPIFGLLEPKA